MAAEMMSPGEYGRQLAAMEPPVSPEVAEAAARVLAVEAPSAAVVEPHARSA